MVKHSRYDSAETQVRTVSCRGLCPLILGADDGVPCRLMASSRPPAPTSSGLHKPNLESHYECPQLTSP
jgi:hypothetical protein